MCTIIKMVHHTRLDAAIGSAALMRQALAQALHHAEHRIGVPAPADRSAADAQRSGRSRARGRRRDRAPDASCARFDRAAQDGAERALPASRPRSPSTGVQTRACGDRRGDGMPGRQRLRRGVDPAATVPRGAGQLDLGGGGNVVCLDALRALEREPDSLEALLAELGSARGADLRLDARLVRLANLLADRSSLEPGPAIWSSSWRWRCRPRSWSAMRRRRSPMRSAPRACPTAPAASSACCQGSISARSAPAPGRCRPRPAYRSRCSPKGTVPSS